MNKAKYEVPVIEIIEAKVEKGFAGSSTGTGNVGSGGPIIIPGGNDVTDDFGE